MKKIIVIACLMLPVAATFSNMPSTSSVKNIEAIIIELSDDLLVAKSNDPGDPLTLLQIWSRTNQLLLQTSCSGVKCTLNCSSLSPGIYIAKAYTVNLHLAQTVYVN